MMLEQTHIYTKSLIYRANEVINMKKREFQSAHNNGNVKNEKNKITNGSNWAHVNNLLQKYKRFYIVEF